MVATNIQTLLLKSLNKTGKRDQILASIIWRSIINDYWELKKIDITSYIISIKLVWNIIFIKTEKPILNTELLHIENILLQNIDLKLQKIWLHIKNMKIKFK